MKKILLTGNEAIGEGAIQAGCNFYAGYPITPQNELTAYMARRMTEERRIFIQAESELAAINMVLGASAAGARAMTSSSSPGISLKQEGISYLAGCQLPCVIVNIMRGGPGLGNIAPAQSDYLQATKGGGHGDYRSIVLAPSSVQEAFDLMRLAFELADQYRNPALILADGMLGQMMEPLQLSGGASWPLTKYRKSKTIQQKKWVLDGCKHRKPNIIRSLLLQEGALEELNQALQRKYQTIQNKHQYWEELFLDDARIILVAYGTIARIARSVVRQLRKRGKKLGLIRPISLWPFPQKAFPHKTSKRIRYLVTEMSYGQMLEDVRLAVEGRAPIEFLGRAGGGIPSEEEIIKRLEIIIERQ
ncbi:MAG: 3-methyl-2-oxobutanoate dehydrogenase subunit VorB [Candidatus Omnitrophota bacterium]|jgi:2-oxoglutarate ferredoxin oxidoreductase subunit alpha